MAAAISADLQPAGHKIVAPDGKVWCELWFRKSSPSGPQTTENDVTWKNVVPAAVHVTGEAIQIHGGMGFTWECDAHLHYRRAKADDLLLGAAATWRHHVAETYLATR